MPESIEELTKIYHSIFQQWLNLAQPLFAAGRPGKDFPGSEDTGDAAVLSRTLLQALSAAGTSSLSYGYAVQSIVYKYQASLLALNLSEADSQHKRAMLIDEIRGFLREIGDTASREGRHFQHQLAIITEQLAQAEAKINQEHAHTTTP